MRLAREQFWAWESRCHSPQGPGRQPIYFFVRFSAFIGLATVWLPPHTFAVSFHCIPAFLQSARVSGCGVASAARAGRLIAAKIMSAVISLISNLIAFRFRNFTLLCQLRPLRL